METQIMDFNPIRLSIKSTIAGRNANLETLQKTVLISNSNVESSQNNYSGEIDAEAKKINLLLTHFAPITLAEMDSVQLMKRIDTKFIINTKQLEEILQDAIGNYRVVEINGDRVLPYTTIYFDTPKEDMYNMHHNGKLNRYKIRTRSYENTNTTFLEIKKKNNKGRTDKKRIKIAHEHFEKMAFNQTEASFIESITPYLSNELSPKLQNYFQRITLVDNNLTERVTIDFGLQFSKTDCKSKINVENLAIIEMKQDGACNSHFRTLLSRYRINPGSMSKYCLGMTMLYPDLRTNRFKKKIRKITKITTHNDSN